MWKAPFLTLIGAVKNAASARLSGWKPVQVSAACGKASIVLLHRQCISIELGRSVGGESNEERRHHVAVSTKAAAVSFQSFS